MLVVCSQLMERQADDVNALLDIGTLLQNFGFLSLASECFSRVRSLAGDDLRPVVNLANLARERGAHADARCLYAELLARRPDQPVIRRNALVSLEYDPDVSDAERLAGAKAWGEWAIGRAGGRRARPFLRPLTDGRPLRVGYVSADFCQHTVGLFVKDVLKSHDPSRVNAFAYSAGQVADWVTDEIRAACQFRAVASLTDVDLAGRIRQDEIDVLVDLSGHTAGSRLTVFAYRPAPVQVSWLGYFATTGLACMDAVLLDEWHDSPGTEAQFVESVVDLPGGRFCYTPVPWAAAVAPAPVAARGYVTFGCFNNTAKLNQGVFDLWARILAAVPDARLVLKWRNFNDEALRQSVRENFARRGIMPERIELRGPSFHVDLLKEYADIDVALDTFPFAGGLTSCEALWMGVPVVTWPQRRVVSRQTFAFLSAIGLPELAAEDADGYARIAVELARDRARLAALRSGMRKRMAASSLMDVGGFTRQLEQCLIGLYQEVNTRENRCAMDRPKILLNVGAGHPASGAKVPQAFQAPEWREVRLDIDPANEPDILGSMTDMSGLADGSVDAVYSSHNIEHLYPDEVPLALREFLRVLRPEGFAVVTCPDLQEAARMIAEDRLMEVAYSSPGGPVTPFDIVYSHRNFTGRDKPFMAHHCGFTLTVLLGTLKANGFVAAAGKRRPAAFDLWVVATKAPMAEEKLRELAESVLPR